MIKHMTYGLIIGVLFMITMNSFGSVIKVDIVTPQYGYTDTQRMQMEMLLK